MVLGGFMMHKNHRTIEEIRQEIAETQKKFLQLLEELETAEEYKISSILDDLELDVE